MQFRDKRRHTLTLLSMLRLQMKMRKIENPWRAFITSGMILFEDKEEKEEEEEEEKE